MNQKLENLLNLALETPEEVRLQTDNLNVGFDSGNRRWELIVKYHGSLNGLEALDVEVEYLINSYAILTVPEQLVEAVSNIEEIEYVEKPKRYYYQDIGPAADSCMTQVTLRDPFLSGAGVLVAVLDSGIDYTRQEFRDNTGRTRIVYLWDQTMRPEEGNVERQSPAGFVQGVEFTAEQINRALETETAQERYMMLPTVDVSGHGTAVAGIAAGCYPAYSRGTAGGAGSRPGALGGQPGGAAAGQASGIPGSQYRGVAPAAGIPGSQYRGVAPAAALLVVKLGLPGEEGFPRTTEIMRGVTYALRKAEELGMPLVINLSFGNTYGSHDGGSLLERFLDNA
ncbi:MAG: S8 family serine peptidase [Acetatifactor sp.]|nr:S8 family serine peptidase [Acetatifactor sp.]